MNIFALSDSPHESAIWQHDRHVVKMILESAQMLSTWARPTDSWSGVLEVVPHQYHDRLYKSTHFNHPCNVWLRSNDRNVVWLALHLDSLVAEYHRRFQKVHATSELRIAFNAAACNIAGVDRMWGRDENRELRLNNTLADMAAEHTPFAVCMPDEFKVVIQNPATEYHHMVYGDVESYRNLYACSKIFQDHVKWTRCDSLPPFLVKPGFGSRPAAVEARIMDLMEANRTQTRPGTVAHVQTPHPDSLKPANPAAITRFGTK